MAEPASPRKRSRKPISVWDLPAQLLASVHGFRKRLRKKGKERRHYAKILAYVYRSRFVTASQVQRRFKEFLPSDRTARRHLAELQEQLGYLELVPTPSPLWPKTYAISRRGLLRLKKQSTDAQSSSLEHKRIRKAMTSQHVVHELFTTEFLLNVWECVDACPTLALLSIQRRSLSQHPAFSKTGGVQRRLVPDAMFMLRQNGAGMLCVFLEIDTGSMSLKQMESKLASYVAWSESAIGQEFLVDLYKRNGSQSPRPVFRIAIVSGGRVGVDEERRIRAMSRVATRLPLAIRNRVWLTTSQELKNAKSPARPLMSSIWRTPGPPDCPKPFVAS